MTEREKFRRIREMLGLRTTDIRRGGTVRSREVKQVASALGVPWAGSIQRTWLAIIEALGGIADSGVDISAPGTGTITDTGFDKVLQAFDLLDEHGLLPVAEAAAAAAAPLPEGETEGRRRVLAEITRRQGQPAFRRELLEAYEWTCAMSGVTDEAVLEAAHILPYDGAATNAVTNGLLLRADLHTLFDRRLIAVHETSLQIVVSPDLVDPLYRVLDGQPLRVPNDPARHPDVRALGDHRAEAGL